MAYTDKRASEQLLAKMQVALERGRRQPGGPYRKQKARAAYEHVADWVAELREAGSSPVYVQQCELRVTRVGGLCSWAKLADMGR